MGPNRRHGWLIAIAATLGLSACLDDPAVRERLGVDQEGRPLSPAPASPLPSGASPAPAASVSPTASASPEASPMPSPSPRQPGVTGNYQKTFDPLDLAIAGPGYFVVSTRPEPRGFDDLLLTRFGAFDLAYVPAGSPAPGGATAIGPGEWRLMTTDGFWVMGYSFTGEENAPPPVEVRSTSYESAFRPGGAGNVGAIVVDGQANLNFAPHFDFKGQLLTDRKPPQDAEGRPRQIFVAVVQVERPAGLQARAGVPMFSYTPQAGAVSVGIAGITSSPAGVPRPVGDANLIRPDTLER